MRVGAFSACKDVSGFMLPWQMGKKKKKKAVLQNRTKNSSKEEKFSLSFNFYFITLLPIEQIFHCAYELLGLTTDCYEEPDLYFLTQ